MADKKRFDPAIHDENPDWTAADFAKSKPASKLPASILAQFPKTKVGRPRAEITKTPVKFRLDNDVIEALRATGPGWQTRVNDFLKSRISWGKVRFDEPVKRKRA